jgi:hypothetical protein
VISRRGNSAKPLTLSKNINVAREGATLMGLLTARGKNC